MSKIWDAIKSFLQTSLGKTIFALGLPLLGCVIVDMIFFSSSFPAALLWMAYGAYLGWRLVRLHATTCP